MLEKASFFSRKMQRERREEERNVAEDFILQFEKERRQRGSEQDTQRKRAGAEKEVRVAGLRSSVRKRRRRYRKRDRDIGDKDRFQKSRLPSFSQEGRRNKRKEVIDRQRDKREAEK